MPTNWVCFLVTLRANYIVYRVDQGAGRRLSAGSIYLLPPAIREVTGQDPLYSPPMP